MASTDQIKHNAIKQVNIEEILKSSFLDYAVSVIVSRALPDVRDGLKPVHRRILYTMQQLGFWHNKPYHKSVRIVGEVLGKFHPHGDQAVYQTMVGLVQNFSKRYPLLDGQGNWGSIDGDNAAAMRYTEVRMQKIAQELLADITKNTVDFVPNFDESTVEPTVLPSKLPHLLINGTSGIAVGMATSIPPHNLGEVVDGCIEIIKNPDLTDDELITYIPAPDFPLGGIIHGNKGLHKAYKEGRGSVTVRGVVTTEEMKKGHAIIISEIPYQVIKSDLIVKIADLVKNKTIEGISNIRDESDKRGMRIVIELKNDAPVETIINMLYKYTQLQSNFNIVMLGLLDNTPQLFTLKQMLSAFIEHRRDVISRRTTFEKHKAEQQEHILAGYEKIITNIEQTIEIIKKSSDAQTAATQLEDIFKLTAEQSKAVLELRLQRLTSMETAKISEERTQLHEKIKTLQYILENPKQRDQEIINELVQIKDTYADKRRTQIIPFELNEFNAASLIPDEEVVITLTHKGYVKRVPLTVYDVQRRGGKGKMGTASLEEKDDIIQNILVSRNHDDLLFFTSLGRVYKKPTYSIPETSRTARGRAIVNLLPLTPGETIVKLISARNLEGLALVMVTSKGTIKRSTATMFSKVRQTGVRCITLNEGDTLAFCALSSGNDSIIIATHKGRGIRFSEKEVRVMGRQAAGVRAIRLQPNDYVVGMQVVSDDRDILFATANGYGKRVKVADFRIAHRGGSGVRTIPTTKRNGDVIGLAAVDDETDMMLIDQRGKIIRLSSKDIRTMGRQAQGVRLIKLDKNQHLVSISALTTDENEDAHERKTEDSDINGEHTQTEEIIEQDLDNNIQDDADIQVDEREIEEDISDIADE